MGIYGHGAIDSVIYEFRQGSIGWDCENGRIQDEKRYGNKIYSDSANDMFANWDDVATQQRLTHSLPTGLYHISFSVKMFCVWMPLPILNIVLNFHVIDLST